ncbi:MAG: hypothetical protein OEX07_02590 [Gammaproteobacteria bacterium]|nr:hypothetical protein [Gammaproteobacteria bacterium]
MTKIKDPQIIKQRKLLRKSTFIIFIGISIFTLLTVLVVKRSPSLKDAMKPAPLLSGNLLNNLSVYKKLNSGEYLPLSEKMGLGDTLGLKVSVLRPTYVGLILSVNQQMPSIVFYGRLPPGENRLLERQGERYLYHVKEGDESLKYCVVSVEDKEGLRKVSAKLLAIWSGIPETSCLIVN